MEVSGSDFFVWRDGSAVKRGETLETEEDAVAEVVEAAAGRFAEVEVVEEGDIAKVLDLSEIA